MVFPLGHLTFGYMLPTSIASPRLSAPKHNYNSNTIVQPSSGSLKLRYMLGLISMGGSSCAEGDNRGKHGPQATYGPCAFLEAVRYHASAILSRFDGLRERAMALGMRLFLNLFDGPTVTTTKRKAQSAHYKNMTAKAQFGSGKVLSLSTTMQKYVNHDGIILSFLDHHTYPF